MWAWNSNPTLSTSEFCDLVSSLLILCAAVPICKMDMIVVVANLLASCEDEVS